MPMSIDIERIGECEFADMLPLPGASMNKYSRGKLTAVGGSREYPGAICLAAHAAERMGAGYVEVVCDPDSIPVVHDMSKSLVVRPWTDWTMHSSSLERLGPEHPQACLIGSGFCGGSDEENRLFAEVMSKCAHPVLVDGGAFQYLATDAGYDFSKRRAHHREDQGDKETFGLVLTPHFGEAARLSRATGIRIPDEASCPVKIEDIHDAYALRIASWAKDIAVAFHAVVVLKGPDTFIATPDSDLVRLMGFGTAALSKAGTGDVLAGLVSSLLAQGLLAVDSCVLGASLHALSGVLAADRLSEVCVCAEDIICFLPERIVSLLAQR